jgi:hypothetical protein
MNNRFGWILALSMVFAGSLAHAADSGAGLGVFGGFHGGALSHYGSGAASDPVKEGIIGLTYGYQLGLDLGAGPLWAQIIYIGSNTWATDYRAAGTEKPDVRYANMTLTVPLMYAITKNNFTIGFGAYYSEPLSYESQRDLGMALAAKTKLGGKFYAGFDWLGGFREQAQGGNNLQFLLNLGYSFK